MSERFSVATRVALVLGLAMAFGWPCSADENTIVMDGSTTVGPIAKAFAEYYMAQNPGVKVTVSESGSGNGAKSLINGTCDIANMSRAMKDEEIKAAKEKGVQPVEHIIAMDGISIVVHPSNPVKELTVEQIRDIYTGKIKNWSEVGGPGTTIVKISRDTNSGTYEAFEELALQKQKISGDAEYVGSNGAMRSRIQKTPAAIGYVGLGFVDRTVKALLVNKVAPTQETVTSRKYPISRPLFMYTNGEPKEGTSLQALVTLYQTEKGQEIVQKIGFVPLTK